MVRRDIESEQEKIAQVVGVECKEGYISDLASVVIGAFLL